jgi:hypothetical protein
MLLLSFSGAFGVAAEKLSPFFLSWQKQTLFEMAIFDTLKTTKFAIYKKQKSRKHQILLKNVSFGIGKCFCHLIGNFFQQSVKNPISDWKVFCHNRKRGFW